jgi:hypothetical protein
MPIALQRPMTREQFLAWEEKQPLHYEFDGFQPVAMTGWKAGRAGIHAIRRSPLAGVCAAVHVAFTAMI